LRVFAKLKLSAYFLYFMQLILNSQKNGTTSRSVGVMLLVLKNIISNENVPA